MKATNAQDESEDLVVEEWTDPEDGMKEAFFRNLNSVLLEPAVEDSRFSGLKIMLQFFVIFYEMDNWPVFVGGGQAVQGWVTHAVLGAAARVGYLLGLKALYEEYTPRALLERVRYTKVTDQVHLKQR